VVFSLVDVSHAFLKDSGMMPIDGPSSSPCEIIGFMLAGVPKSNPMVCFDGDHAPVAVVVLVFEWLGEALIGFVSFSDAFEAA